MKFGIVLASEVDSWRWAVRAEELGFNSVWFYDSQMLFADVFVSMALAAHHTKRIRLGTGVAVPSNRVETAAANSLASLNKLAPGRIDFGVGTGYTARRTIGLGAITLAKTRTYIERVAALVKGETIEWDFEGKERKVRFINPDLGIINTEDEVAMWFSATGPKSRRLAAELGTGWLNFSAMEGAVESLHGMQQSWLESGRAVDDMNSQLFFLGAVLTGDKTTDEKRLIEQAGPSTATIFRSMADAAGKITGSGPAGEMGDAFKKYLKTHQTYEPEDARYLSNHRGHMMFMREDETHISPDLIKRTTISGKPEELVENLGLLKEAGYDQVNIQLVRGHEQAIEEWAEVFKQVGELNA